ncbi:hypothetical protein [Bacillus atrophaeus]|nr:hypothetical protein [Bacillus atrophaeus]MCM3461122.1 hypothetical protein [Bacillus atrophaeus]MEC1857633.1 hypothetical protein [Bacillus atrophaeus]MEC2035802.1 hypothetical protein [Bacillus atrophaeus]MEC2356190.1 hypothetical protein [Bacillus atrophaeus]MEC2361124.1 hypothetical protein [Bacillus atrophaeus]
MSRVRMPSASIKPLGTGLLYHSDRHTGSGSISIFERERGYLFAVIFGLTLQAWPVLEEAGHAVQYLKEIDLAAYGTGLHTLV